MEQSGFPRSMSIPRVRLTVLPRAHERAADAALASPTPVR
jgi:hypothetical protein